MCSLYHLSRLILTRYSQRAPSTWLLQQLMTLVHFLSKLLFTAHREVALHSSLPSEGSTHRVRAFLARVSSYLLQSSVRSWVCWLDGRPDITAVRMRIIPSPQYSLLRSCVATCWLVWYACIAAILSAHVQLQMRASSWSSLQGVTTGCRARSWFIGAISS